MKKLLSVLLLLSMLLTPVFGNADATWSTGYQGYQSEVKVSVTFDDAGNRIAISVDASGETSGEAEAAPASDEPSGEASAP